MRKQQNKTKNQNLHSKKKIKSQIRAVKIDNFIRKIANMCLCCQTNQKKKVRALVKWNQGARVSGKHTELQQNKTKKKEK